MYPNDLDWKAYPISPKRLCCNGISNWHSIVILNYCRIWFLLRKAWAFIKKKDFDKIYTSVSYFNLIFSDQALESFDSMYKQSPPSEIKRSKSFNQSNRNRFDRHHLHQPSSARSREKRSGICICCPWYDRTADLFCCYPHRRHSDHRWLDTTGCHNPRKGTWIGATGN